MTLAIFSGVTRKLSITEIDHEIVIFVVTMLSPTRAAYLGAVLIGYYL